MNPDLESAGRIQVIDQKVASLEREVAALPRYIAELERQLESHRKQFQDAKSNLAANEKDRRTLEGTVMDAQAKIKKLRGQMLDAKTNEQYAAFQKEITHFESVISTSEDRILELMEAAETLEGSVRKLEAELAAEQKKVDDQKVKARDRAAADEKAIADLKTQRAALVAKMAPAVVTAYERTRKKVGPNVVCEVVDGICTGCRLGLRPQYFQELKTATDVRYCENCTRIIYYNPPIAPPA